MRPPAGTGGAGDPDAPWDDLVVPLEELRRRRGVKWWRYRGTDVLACWVADMDLRPPPPVVRAVTGDAASGDLGYPPTALAEEVAAAWAEWSSARHGWRPDPGLVDLTTDVVQGIHLALRVWSEPGDGVVVTTPVYPPFLAAVSEQGRRLVEVPLVRGPDRWMLDVDRLRAAVDDRTRVLLWCNPHNPTGHVFDASELAAVAELACERDLIVVSDEIHADLCHPGAVHVPAATVDGLADRTVTLTSPTKAFNIAGLRCAVAHVPHRLRRAWDGVPPHERGQVSAPAQRAAVAAWREGGPWLDRVRSLLTANRDGFARRVGTWPGVEHLPARATYLGWCDFRGARLNDVSPARWLVHHARVAPSPGEDFGSPGVGWARFNLATAPSILGMICDRVEAALAGRPGH